MDPSEAEAARVVVVLPTVLDVVVIHDHPVARDGLVALLDQVADLRVVGGESCAELRCPSEVDPDVVLLDLGRSEGGGLRLAEGAGLAFPNAGIIVMDLLAEHEDVMEFVQLGVRGFTMQNTTLDDLVGTIRAVSEGARVLPAPLMTSLSSQIARVAVGSDAPEERGVTLREGQVIHLILRAWGIVRSQRGYPSRSTL